MSALSSSHAASASGISAPIATIAASAFGPGSLEPVAALQRAVLPAVVGALDLGDRAGREAEVGGLAGRIVDQAERLLHHRRKLVGKGGLVMAKARLAERDQRRVDRLVGAAFGPERDAARRRDQQEARVLVAGVVEAIEAAGDERVVERSDREQPLAEQVARQAERGQHQEKIGFSAMPSSMCWPLICRRPFLRGGNLCLGENVGHFAPLEQAALVHPGAEVGRDGDVGRGGDDAVGKRRRRTWRGRAGCGRTRPGSIAPRPAGAGMAGIATVPKSRSRFSRAMRLRSISASTPARALPPIPASGSHSWPSAMPIAVAQRVRSGSGSSGRRDCPCGRRRAGRSP